MRFMPALALAGGFFLFGMSVAFAQDQDPASVLSLRIEGRASGAPDMALLRLGVESQAGTAREAVDSLSASLEGVFAALRAADIPQTNIQTSAMSLYPLQPRYESGHSQGGPSGYSARSDISVRVDDPTRVGAILDAAVDSGANVFNGIEFSIADPRDLQDRARLAAVAEAGRRAQLYAEAAGVTLGPIIRLVEDPGDGPAMMRMNMAEAASADAVPVSPGEVVVTVHIAVDYALEPQGE